MTTDTNLKENSPGTINSSIESIVPGATKLTPLELNNIKLDDKHTLLTPDYLENLSKVVAE